MEDYFFEAMKDSDASYYDDVTAFITAFEDYVKTE